MQSDRKQDRLLSSMAEHMKLPLLQIARRAELGKLINDSQDALNDIEQIANGSLKLIDSYLLSIVLAKAQNNLHLEPVSISAVMNDVAHALSKLAKQYQCDLELHIAGKYEPIMAHREGLEAAITSLGFVFIEAQNAQSHERQPVVKLAAHRSRQGIVAGTFADTEDLGTDVYRRALGLYGRARQPLNQLTSATGAGVFVADSLLASMSTKLRVARHQKLTGLAATFMPSHQMSLV
jgi:hypothetical protein